MKKRRRQMRKIQSRTVEVSPAFFGKGFPFQSYVYNNWGWGWQYGIWLSVLIWLVVYFSFSGFNHFSD
ncbi:MAG: hypothetical protein H0Z33_00895 [Bacillaceae bacterium]|nr:hypothetical protein [Bacillaceae bacterium]